MAGKKETPERAPREATRIFSARISRELVKQLRRFALDNDLKMQQVVTEAFREYLDSRKK